MDEDGVPKARSFSLKMMSFEQKQSFPIEDQWIGKQTISESMQASVPRTDTLLTTPLFSINSRATHRLVYTTFRSPR